MKFTRKWAMPDSETFNIECIHDFVWRHLAESKVSVDPFSRNKRWATHTNDLDPNTDAEHHMDAEAFLKHLEDDGVRADLVIFDPPYSPRQISECYKGIGLEVGMVETQSASLYKRVRDAVSRIMAPQGIVLSFGWSSNGMGINRGYEIEEILMVCHGGAHNDTICLAERREPTLFDSLESLSLDPGPARG